MAYVVPPAADLKIRYPAFAAVDDAVVTYWITDAERFVDTSWIEGDYAPALMALAAHSMAIGGLGTDAAALAALPGGVSRIKSGSLEASLTDAAANARATGSFDATRYGQEYRAMLRRNKAGPRIGNTGALPAPDWQIYPVFPLGQV